MDPTNSQFEAYRAMWTYFNEVLFSGALTPVILNFSRAANSLGFFAPERWERGQETTHEISLNPAYLRRQSPRDVASTLVHEMAHLWQWTHGKPGRRGYHNEEWATKMDILGLPPSSTGAPGGARVGYRMSHYIAPGGAFDRAFDAMPREYLLPWTCWEPDGKNNKKKPRASKLKYTCPTCAANAWGKPSLSLYCGDCDEAMVCDDDDDGDGGAHALRAA